MGGARPGQHQVPARLDRQPLLRPAPPTPAGSWTPRERGVKFIVVDPRKSPMAGIADIHLQLRPGTDGALALAMANVIIAEGLYDRQFVSEWTRGFDEFKAYAAEFTPERAEQITGVPAALIREAAAPLCHHQAGRHDAQCHPGGAPHQRRAEPAGRGRARGTDRQLRRARRQRGRSRPAGWRSAGPGSPPASASSRCRARGATCRPALGASASRCGPR